MSRSKMEAAAAALFLVAAIVTAIIPDWIEAVTGFDPDGGNGSLEWVIVAVFGVLAVAVGYAARRDYVRGAVNANGAAVGAGAGHGER